MSITHHADFHFRVFRTFQSVLRFLIRNDLTNERLPVNTYDLVTSQYSGTFGRPVLDDVLHMNGVLPDCELDADTRERTAQIIVGGLHVFCIDVDRVGIKLCQYLRNGLINKGIDVHLVNVLVVDDMQQIVEPVASRVDDVESVAREMIGIKGSDKDAHDDTNGHDERHPTVIFLLLHNYCPVSYKSLLFPLYATGRYRLPNDISPHRPHA